MTAEVLQAALDFHSAGVCVVPASEDGSKRPIGTWKQYQVSKPSLEQIHDWFGGNAIGIGIITGAVSGNLEMLEMEGRGVTSGLLEEARNLAINSGLEELWEIVTHGYLEMTPSGGIHMLYRIADEPVPGNTKLARRPGENGTVEVLAETRGEGGFVVTAPSSGTTHPSSRPWVKVAGSPAMIPMLSMEERNSLHTLFQALDAMPVQESIAKTITPSESSGEKPGDDFNTRTSWKEILEPVGWKQLFTSHGVTYWRRPGKSQGVSASTGRNDSDNLFVFTTSTTFEAEKPYSKFAAYAHIHHRGDFSAAARQLRSEGFGSANFLEPKKPSLSVVPDLDADHVEIPAEPTSWLPKPLDLSGATEEEPPEFLSRVDGYRLFYKGKVNALIGESESGKTWVALFAVKQALHIGQTVTYIDFEDSGKGILARLRLLGLEDRHFAKFTYANPDEAFTLEAKIDLQRAIETLNPDLIVVDGVNAAMTLLGLDLMSNRDATFFSQTILRPLTSKGACVITIDHVTKSKDARGNNAIGAQAKRADINGCAIIVEVVQPFGRGMTGELNLRMSKDRAGHVRAISKDAKLVGRVVIKSDDSGIEMGIHPFGDGTQKIRPTHLMEKVSKLLEAAKAPLSKNVIENEVAGKREFVRLACQVLIDEKFVGIEHGSRNSLNLKLLTPYRESTDTETDVREFIYESQDSDIA